MTALRVAAIHTILAHLAMPVLPPDLIQRHIRIERRWDPQAAEYFRAERRFRKIRASYRRREPITAESFGLMLEFGSTFLSDNEFAELLADCQRIGAAHLIREEPAT